MILYGFIIGRIIFFLVLIVFLVSIVIFYCIGEKEDNIKGSEKEKNRQSKKREDKIDEDKMDSDERNKDEVGGDEVGGNKIDGEKTGENKINDNRKIIQATSGRELEQKPSGSPKIVINSKSEYEPEYMAAPFDFQGKVPNPQNDARNYLILGSDAFKKLKIFLDWGRRTRRNRVEQGGVLLGHIACYANEVYCFVDDILLADTAGDSVFVEFTNEMWAAMQDELAEINTTRGKKEKLVIVGWFHTHPNKLSVFMSGTDMNTQRLNFSHKWQASLVMNPHMDKYRAFFGARAVEGKVVLPEYQKESKH